MRRVFARDRFRLPGCPHLSRRSVLVALLGLTLSTLSEGVSADDPGCRRWRAAFAGMPVRLVAIEAGGRAITLQVKVADTPERQAAGFQCATRAEIKQHLILFDFGGEILTQFHMQNVPAPLDIAFIKADGRVFSIFRMEPNPTALYGPLGPFRYALEAGAGFFSAHGVKPGSARLLPSP